MLSAGPIEARVASNAQCNTGTPSTLPMLQILEFPNPLDSPEDWTGTGVPDCSSTMLVKPYRIVSNNWCGLAPEKLEAVYPRAYRMARIKPSSKIVISNCQVVFTEDRIVYRLLLIAVSNSSSNSKASSNCSRRAAGSRRVVNSRVYKLRINLSLYTIALTIYCTVKATIKAATALGTTL
ncbi:hypothetical protein P280DRAFT_477083 [Massarina eburnea CBS 473.64]|uniref:Uncharacterized protein n=1 Tax=Massarina eburnea CBS 473.64 TaxID=1395130 RepID=A0A6A6SB99_9PLEO|nr:hypothetical protein P280DRAFT_477083 [Massarina eburnea CBS 473.64]